MNYLSCDSISNHYRNGEQSFSVLNDVSFSAKKGEVVAILGQSGSGKSSLLNILGGLQKPDNGSITVDGCEITALNEKDLTQFRRARLGFIYQFFNLLPTLKVREQLAMVLELNRCKKSEIEARVDDKLQLLGIHSKAELSPDQLSGGEQQRVAIARALIHEPNILLADEPTGNLDAHTGDDVLHLLLDVARRNDTCCLIVTHSKKVAEAADRVLVMMDGKLSEGDATVAW